MSSDFSYNVEVTPLSTIAIPGPVGPSGPSAYAVAVEGGYAGSEAEWIASLTGPSAYAVWLGEGNSGTEADFIAAIEGTSAYEEWLNAGNSGTESDFLASLVGPPGLSAYGVWIQAGNSGTPDDFLAFITGPRGPSGYSAYTIAVMHGFVGTEAQWLASLKGASGTSSWSSLTGVPATFPPSPHTHAQTDVTGLVAALNSKTALSTVVPTSMSVTGGGAMSGLASISFVNDRANPGPFAFYGTNNLGGRGWWAYGSVIAYNVPAAGDATTSQVVLGSDSRLTNARSPLGHSLSHSFGASDPIQITKAQISDLPGVVSPTAIGFVPKLPTTNPTGVFFRGDGNYAAPPSGGSAGINFSLSEAWTGLFWVDGKNVYQKTVNIGALPNTTSRATAHGIVNISTILSQSGFAATSTAFIPLPYPATVAASAISVSADTTNVTVTTGSATWTSYSAYVTLRYTCTDR